MQKPCHKICIIYICIKPFSKPLCCVYSEFVLLDECTAIEIEINDTCTDERMHALCIIPLHLMVSSLFLQFRVIWHSNVRYLNMLLLLNSLCGGRINKFVNVQYQQIESTPGYGFIITFPHFLALFTFTLEEDF